MPRKDKDKPFSFYIPPEKVNWNELAESLASLSRAEIIRTLFATYPNSVPVAIGNRIRFLDASNLTFSAKEVLRYVDVDDFTKWASSFHPDFEEVDGQEFYEIFIRKAEDQSLSVDEIVGMINAFMGGRYPEPNSQVFSSFNPQDMTQKDYYLPALKVLNEDEQGMLWSPAFRVPWVDDVLDATHIPYGFSMTPGVSIMPDDVHLTDRRRNIDYMSSCTCGIYATVNLDELVNYMFLEPSNGAWLLDSRFDSSRRRLCIVEPDQHASVYIARKGWKASRVFVSEIVGKTIGIFAASNLLSMVWNRKVDLSRLSKIGDVT